jgi:hypothetical protein
MTPSDEIKKYNIEFLWVVMIVVKSSYHGGEASHILNLGISWRWVAQVSLIPGRELLLAKCLNWAECYEPRGTQNKFLASVKMYSTGVPAFFKCCFIYLIGLDVHLLQIWIYWCVANYIAQWEIVFLVFF